MTKLLIIMASSIQSSLLNINLECFSLQFLVQSYSRRIASLFVIGRVQEAQRGMNVVMSFDCGTRLIVRVIRYTERSGERKPQSLVSNQKKVELQELKILWCG